MRWIPAIGMTMLAAGLLAFSDSTTATIGAIGWAGIFGGTEFLRRRS